MAEAKVKSWKEVFTANYEGKSPEAKALEPFLKETYKGDVYIPWAVMERLVYMSDENAVFENVKNENGGLVHSDIINNSQYNLQKGEVISETKADMFAHFVRVKLTFMGKEFVEDYPIQEQDYSAARVFNQNLVNRALQRAKAKLGARATGLGLKLYEGFDLQFDSKEEDKKPVLDKVVEEVKEPAKTTKKPVKKEEVVEAKVEEKVEAIPVVESVEEIKQEIDSDTKELVDIILNTEEEKMNPVLQRVNISIMKKYSFALSNKDTREVLIEKISKFPNVAQFKKTIINLLG